MSGNFLVALKNSLLYESLYEDSCAVYIGIILYN